MSKKPSTPPDTHPQFILSANDLLSGAVVYLTPSGRWSTSIKRSLVINAPHTDHVLANIPCQYDSASVVDILPVQMQADASAAWQPMTMRARIRLLGPSIVYGRHTTALTAAADKAA